MITDIWTVMLKEWKEFLHQRGSAKGSLIMIFLPACIIGVLFPLQMGSKWVESPVSIFILAWLSMLLASAMIVDSFAGERERHTLETLLASRLSDRAILFGKICAVMVYVIGILVFIVLLSIVTVNLSHGLDEVLLFPAKLFLTSAIISFLMALFISVAGVLVSLKAATVRQAHQSLTLFLIALWLLPIVGMQLLPTDLIKNIKYLLKMIDPVMITAIFIAGLIVLDAVLLAASMTRFKRARMNLD